MKANVNYNFKVIHAINFDLFEKKSAATSTYEVEFEQLESKDFKIELRRKDFKLNDKEIDLKFERIAYEYNKALYPVLFDVKEDVFLLSNFNEISERIALKDEELQLKHEGPGFQHIRNQFLENVTQDGYAMSRHFFSFGLMKIIMFCFQETGNYENFDFHWDITPLGTTLFYKGNTFFDPALNILKYESIKADTETLFEEIKKYGIENKYPQLLTQEDALITTTISNQTQFVTSKLDFEFSEIDVKINNAYFNYKETLSISRKY